MTVNVRELGIGDVVYAAKLLVNDGSIPDAEDGVVLAEAGARGVIVQKGHVEGMPEKSVFVVRFEDKDLNLGLPVGCWADELSGEAVDG